MVHTAQILNDILGTMEKNRGMAVGNKIFGNAYIIFRTPANGYFLLECKPPSLQFLLAGFHHREQRLILPYCGLVLALHFLLDLAEHLAGQADGKINQPQKHAIFQRYPGHLNGHCRTLHQITSYSNTVVPIWISSPEHRHRDSTGSPFT